MVTVSKRTDQPARRLSVRRRVSVVIVTVAALSAGAVALIAGALGGHYRWSRFHSTALRETRLALSITPQSAAPQDLDALLRAYAGQTDASTVAIGPNGNVTSDAPLNAQSIPGALRGRSDTFATATAHSHGRTWWVVSGGRRGGIALYFFYNEGPIRQSIRDFEEALVAAWLITVTLAGAGGAFVARRALRPVAVAANGARQLTEHITGRVIDAGEGDEFAAWSQTFDEMRVALEATIAELNSAAARERQFTADMAHDVRTPLTSVVALASVLLDQAGELPADTRGAVELLAADVTRLRDLILEILELARLDVDGTSNMQRVDTREAVLAAVMSLPDRVARRIHCDVPRGVPALADPSRLRRVLHNLMINGVEHGGTDVFIRARCERSSTGIDVCDAGPGIRAEDAPRLFDRFYKADPSRAGRGAGLGLAIAAQHARAMHGEIAVGVAPEGGACFTLTLPAPDEAS